MTVVWLVVVVASVAFPLACATVTPYPTATPPSRLTLTSTAFALGSPIPTDYTCDGIDRSPPLAWSDPPAGTAAFVLVVEDPDAPGSLFTHWLLYDLPASARSLPAGVPPRPALENGARQGRNDFGTVGYRGPCPPPGRPHRYVFRLFALDQPTGLPAAAHRADVLRALAGHTLATGELYGTYGR